ncbi:hypothetical protein BC831DRAFT_504918 [Entophlyctis helioformis]|nr:hypothetical protein BC831DRAFT_504918 [Entophlyctis helioformis]
MILGSSWPTETRAPAEHLAHLLVGLGYRPKAARRNAPSSGSLETSRALDVPDELSAASTTTTAQLAQQLEWTFGLDSTRPFVAWLCDALQDNDNLADGEPPSPHVPFAATLTKGTPEDQHPSSAVHGQLRGFDVLSEEEAGLYELLLHTMQDLGPHFLDGFTLGSATDSAVDGTTGLAVADHVSPGKAAAARSKLFRISQETRMLQDRRDALARQRPILKSASDELQVKLERLYRLENSLSYEHTLQDESIPSSAAKLDLSLDQTMKTMSMFLDTHSQSPVQGKSKLAHYFQSFDSILARNDVFLKEIAAWVHRTQAICDRQRAMHNKHCTNSDDRSLSGQDCGLFSRRMSSEIDRLKTIEALSHQRSFAADMRATYLESKRACVRHLLDESATAAMIVQLADASTPALKSGAHMSRLELSRLRKQVLEPAWQALSAHQAGTELQSTMFASLSRHLTETLQQTQELVACTIRLYSEMQLASIVQNHETQSLETSTQAARHCLDRLLDLANQTNESLAFLQDPANSAAQSASHYVTDHDEMGLAMNALVSDRLKPDPSASEPTLRHVGASALFTATAETDAATPCSASDHEQQIHATLTSADALVQQLSSFCQDHARMADKLGGSLGTIAQHVDFMTQSRTELLRLAMHHSQSSIVQAAPAVVYSLRDRVRDATNELKPLLGSLAKVRISLGFVWHAGGDT